MRKTLLMALWGMLALTGNHLFGEIIVDDFAEKSKQYWKITSGSNIKYYSTFGEKIELDGKEVSVLKLSFEKLKIAKRKAKYNWFTISRPLSSLPSWKNANGIKLQLSVEKNANWWLQLKLHCDGEVFTKPLIPYTYTKKILQDRLILFKNFKNKNKKKIIPEKITAITITGSAALNTLFFEGIYLSSKSKISHFVKFTTNERVLNIFQPGEVVQMTFSVTGGSPANAKFLRYEIIDYFNKVVTTADLTISGNKTYTTSFDPTQPGYYDVKAYWVDSKGKKLSDESCIKTTGSLSQGRGTFAVVPNTLEQNMKKMKALGDNAFFGFHGNAGYKGKSLTDLLGTTWKLTATRWKNYEKKRPKIINETAAWATRIMAKKPPKSESYQGLFNECLNLPGNFPKWAKAENIIPYPGLKNPKDFYRYLRDAVKVHKHFYPHMKRRIYDVLWEVNLNQPKLGIHPPLYSPKDVIDAYRQAGEVIKSEDPSAIIAGPSSNSPIQQFEWHIPLFKNGLLKYIDAFNCHAYHAPPPEESRVVETFRRLQKTMKQYNNGKPVDIYCTELGYRSQYGSQDKHKEQAQWHVRVATILKGEGMKVYYPFYSYDFSSNDTWGVCYNLDPKLKFGSKRLSPKAAVPALAVCVNELEGTSPLSDLPFFGSDIWCYIFKDDKTGEPLIVLWSVRDTHKLNFPAGNVKSLKLTDIMGRHSEITVKNGLVNLKVSPSPIYIRGADRNIYSRKGRIADKLIGQFFPGEKSELKLSKTPVSQISYWGEKAKIKLSSSRPGYVDVKIPGEARPGAVPILFDNNKEVKWLVIRGQLKILAVKLKVAGSKIGIALDVKNLGGVTLPAKISLNIPGKKNYQFEKILKANATTNIYMPLKQYGKINPNQALQVSLSIKAGNLSEIKLNKKFSFLTAHRRGESSKGKLTNLISWKGKGASRKMDKAEASFSWDNQNLYMTVKVNDDVFYQTRTDNTVWMMDSLQIAFDSHPDQASLYAPLAGVYTKKITEVAFAKTSDKNMAWRSRSHNVEELEIGDISAVMGVDIVRNEKRKLTVYKLSIPWKEIGLDAVKKGKSIGISILLNDSDGIGTRRAGLELFSGIMEGKNYKLYGMITLR